MLVKDMPIQQKLMRVIILISGVVLIVTCVTFFVYEFYAFRKTTTEKLSTIGKIISTNSTAALSFDDADGAKEILAALKAEPHIMAAALYDKDGNLFSQYPSNLKPTSFPGKPQHDGYHFIHSHLEGYDAASSHRRESAIRTDTSAWDTEERGVPAWSLRLAKNAIEARGSGAHADVLQIDLKAVGRGVPVFRQRRDLRVNR